MTNQGNCPLGDKHCEQLDKALSLAAQARELTQKCLDCGLPMDDIMGQIKATEQLATNLKRTFFPNRV